MCAEDLHPGQRNFKSTVLLKNGLLQILSADASETESTREDIQSCAAFSASSELSPLPLCCLQTVLYTVGCREHLLC